jgi:ABC-type antimicrobial peptide transport system permease subunit
MALGATPGSVIQLILRHGLKLAALGLALGLAAALGLTHLLKSVLFQVSAFDPLSFVAVAAVLTLIGAFACWLPARRATKVEPVEALRAE